MTAASLPGPLLGSTYRLQLAGLGFSGATALVDYLDRLGVDTLYVSPILAAAPGSTHGYDVIDPTRLDPTVGTDAEFESLLAALAAHGMRLLIDIVPNHMATHRANAWWWDVLRRGRHSLWARIFDIDWTQHEERVLLPTLGQPLDATLATGHPRVSAERDDAELELSGQSFPLDPITTPSVGPLSTEQAWKLLDRQHYLPAYWRRSGDEGNYRRFFDIDGLVGVRVEDDQVRHSTHQFLLELVADDRIAGFRVDHIDGLARPSEYLHWIGQAARSRRNTEPAVLVEKILRRDETMPPDWETTGTTGYEFADLAGGLFVASSGGTDAFEAVVLQAKRQVLEASFTSSVDRLTRMAFAVLEAERPGHDLSLAAVRRALAELTLHLRVYRTYFDGEPTESDQRRLAQAADRAGERLTVEGRRALDCITGGFLGNSPVWRAIAERWQQLTGAVTAKGVEDTASFRFDGFLGHAEVGSDPARPEVTPDEFVDAMIRRQAGHPGSLNTTSTHDAKRSEDVRARLYALSEWRDEWLEQVVRWRQRQAPWIRQHGGPDPHSEHVVYQLLIALWRPGHDALDEQTCRRVQDAVVKAAREAKVQTNWTDPDKEFESTLVDFVDRVARGSSGAFGFDAATWVDRIGPAAATNSLALTVLKAICPGVPDVYQGNELWEFALTDPDNRRPVDFALRRQVLDGLPDPAGSSERPGPTVGDLVDQWPDGRIKLYVLRSLLAFRRQHRELMACGRVVPLAVSGPLADHVVALGRQDEEQWVVAVVPRLLRRAGAGAGGAFALGPAFWRGTTITLPETAPTQFTNIFTGVTTSWNSRSLPIAQVFGQLPVAVLAS